MNGSLVPRPATLRSSRQLVPEHRLFVIEDSSDQIPLPGQFMQISLPGIGEFPVSTAGLDASGAIETCIRRAGRVTSALFNQPEGSRIGLRGPYGNGFPLEAFHDRDVVLIAGGLGMAPLRALLFALLERRETLRSLTLLYGSRAPESLLFADELLALQDDGKVRVRFSVDFATHQPWSEQPGLCRIGLVTELLDELPEIGPDTVAAVCGPPVLYSCLLEQLAAAGIPATHIYATLERRMRCGVGSCCHCVTAGQFICRDGPVYSLSQLRTMPGAVEGVP